MKATEALYIANKAYGVDVCLEKIYMSINQRSRVGRKQLKIYVTEFDWPVYKYEREKTKWYKLGKRKKILHAVREKVLATLRIDGFKAYIDYSKSPDTWLIVDWSNPDEKT